MNLEITPDEYKKYTKLEIQSEQWDTTLKTLSLDLESSQATTEEWKTKAEKGLAEIKDLKDQISELSNSAEDLAAWAAHKETLLTQVQEAHVQANGACTESELAEYSAKSPGDLLVDLADLKEKWGRTNLGDLADPGSKKTQTPLHNGRKLDFGVRS